MKTKKFGELTISDREPKVGDRMICIQKNNCNFGHIINVETEVSIPFIDMKNWKVIENTLS